MSIEGMINCDFGAEAVDRAKKLLTGIPGGINKAVKNAMPRAASALRGGTTRAIQQKYDISAANLRTNDNAKINYTYENGVTAHIRFNGKKIPLYRYNGTTPRQPSVNSGKTVIAIIGGNPKPVHPGVAPYAHQFKSSSPKKFNDAFIAKMSSGHIGIFERTGGVTAGGSDQIKEIQGSSIPQMLGNKEIQKGLAKTAEKKFEERMDHEVLRLLNGWGN